VAPCSGQTSSCRQACLLACSHVSLLSLAERYQQAACGYPCGPAWGSVVGLAPPPLLSSQKPQSGLQHAANLCPKAPQLVQAVGGATAFVHTSKMPSSYDGICRRAAAGRLQEHDCRYSCRSVLSGWQPLSASDGPAMRARFTTPPPACPLQAFNMWEPGGTLRRPSAQPSSRCQPGKGPGRRGPALFRA
jgi:hypothetical protein